MAETGLLLYGIVPGDVETTAEAHGVGDPPGQVRIVRHGALAALVSEVRLDQPIGLPADLTAFQQLLDDTAAVAPVLPVRFGTVVTGKEVVADLLSAHGDRYRAALDEFEGRTEYLVHGRYAEDALISALLADSPAMAQLAEQVRGQPVEVSRDERMRLGEMIGQAVELRREADNRYLLDAVESMVVSSAVRPPSHEYDSVQIAFLVDIDRRDEFVAVVEAVAEQWRELARLRLLGPLAPYDFVDAHQLTG